MNASYRLNTCKSRGSMEEACFFCIKVYGILSKIAFHMLNLTPQRWKASAKVEQNIITTKPATNFFYAKTKFVPN